MIDSNMSFGVNSDSIIYNIFNTDIKARLSCRGNPEKRKIYKKMRVISSSPVITKFMIKYPNVFKNKKLINSDGNNFFSEILSISTLSDTEYYTDMLRNRMKYEYDLTDEELASMNIFLEDLSKLSENPEIIQLIDETRQYKNFIERLWRVNEQRIMRYIMKNLCYEPDNIGKVNVYVMFPNCNTHRSCQLTSDKTFLFFGKRDGEDENKILAYLAHQAIHQPILPYKTSMTKSEKEKFHAFIKFLTDKDVYYFLTGKSYLDIITQNENHKIMADVYPFWLGYKYRNIDKDGLNPESEIEKDIKRDKDYYNGLSQNSKRRKLYKIYNFEKLDAGKIAQFFKGKRYMTPYEFAKINFLDKRNVYNDSYLPEAR